MKVCLFEQVTATPSISFRNLDGNIDKWYDDHWSRWLTLAWVDDKGNYHQHKIIIKLISTWGSGIGLKISFTVLQGTIRSLEYQTDVRRCLLDIGINLGKFSRPHKCTGALDLGLIPVVKPISKNRSFPKDVDDLSPEPLCYRLPREHTARG